jgi:hypothetical protein
VCGDGDFCDRKERAQEGDGIRFAGVGEEWSGAVLEEIMIL